jgi:hypothetical protein
MRKVIAGLTVALCTFALGITIAFIWSEFYRSNSQTLEGISRIPLPACKGNVTLEPDVDITASADLPLLTYCELADNPSCYSGKIVRVKAKFSWDDHGWYLFDENCASGRASVKLNDISFDEFNRQLGKACGGICDPSLDIVVVGIFETSEASRQTELFWDARPFRFKLKRLERMSKSN